MNKLFFVVGVQEGDMGHGYGRTGLLQLGMICIDSSNVRTLCSQSPGYVTVAATDFKDLQPGEWMVLAYGHNVLLCFVDRHLVFLLFKFLIKRFLMVGFYGMLKGFDKQ